MHTHSSHISPLCRKEEKFISLAVDSSHFKGNIYQIFLLLYPRSVCFLTILWHDVRLILTTSGFVSNRMFYFAGGWGFFLPHKWPLHGIHTSVMLLCWIRESGKDLQSSLNLSFCHPFLLCLTELTSEFDRCVHCSRNPAGYGRLPQGWLRSMLCCIKCCLQKEQIHL